MKSLTKYLLLLIALLALINIVNAQVGIGLNNPNPKVILDIKSVNKGVLIPRTNANCDMTPYDGSLVYDSVSHKFKYCNVSTWLTVNPLNTDVNDNVTAPKSLVVTDNLTVNGTAVSIPNATTVNTPNATVTANTFVGNGTVPVGGIIMWSGVNGNWPDNWKLCDGGSYTSTDGKTYKTPNLSGKFIVAGYNTSDPSAVETGGNDQITLTTDNLPFHSHNVKILSAESGRHTHGYQTHSSGNEDYSFGRSGNGGPRTTYGYHTTNNINGADNLTWDGGYSPSNNMIESPSHQHSVIGTTAIAGGIYHPDTRVYDYNGTTDQFTCDPTLLLEPLNADICQCDQEIQDPSVPYFQLIPNPNYYDGNFSCTRKDYNPNYGNLISGIPEYWTIQPFDNRPTYYVLAFIMRVK